MYARKEGEGAPLRFSDRLSWGFVPF